MESPHRISLERFHVKPLFLSPRSKQGSQNETPTDGWREVRRERRRCRGGTKREVYLGLVHNGRFGNTSFNPSEKY